LEAHFAAAGSRKQETRDQNTTHNAGTSSMLRRCARNRSMAAETWPCHGATCRTSTRGPIWPSMALLYHWFCL